VFDHRPQTPDRGVDGGGRGDDAGEGRWKLPTFKLLLQSLHTPVLRVDLIRVGTVEAVCQGLVVWGIGEDDRDGAFSKDLNLLDDDATEAIESPTHLGRKPRSHRQNSCLRRARAPTQRHSIRHVLRNDLMEG
jgi:hypothetical protein